MTVFSILAVALLYRRTSAECTGIYVSGVPVAPLDVCLDISLHGSRASSTYSCSGDVGYYNYYTGRSCYGTAVSQTVVSRGTIDAPYTAVCTGETCDYAVQQTYLADNAGRCTDDYRTTASFVGVCFVGVGGSSSSQGVCTNSTYTANIYATTDCTGSIDNAQSTDDDKCASVISCGAETDGTDSTPEPSSVPSVSPSLDVDTPEPSSVPLVSDTLEPTMAQPTTTNSPSTSPTTSYPSASPLTGSQTDIPSSPPTAQPSLEPTTILPTASPTTSATTSAMSGNSGVSTAMVTTLIVLVVVAAVCAAVFAVLMLMYRQKALKLETVMSVGSGNYNKL